MAFRDVSLKTTCAEEKKPTDKFTALVTHPNISKSIFCEFLGMKELAKVSALSKEADKAVTTYLTKTNSPPVDAKHSAANLWSQLATTLEQIVKDSEFKFQGKATFDTMEPLLASLVKTSQTTSQRWDIIKVDLLLNLIQDSLIQVFQTARETFEKRIGQRTSYEFYLESSRSIPPYIWSLVSLFKKMKLDDLKPNTPIQEKLLDLVSYFSRKQDVIFKYWILTFINNPKKAKQEWPSHLQLESGIDQTMLYGKQKEPGVYLDVEFDVATHEHRYNALSFAAYHNLVDLARYLILKRGALVNPQFAYNPSSSCYSKAYCELNHPIAEPLFQITSDEIFWFFLKQIKTLEKYKREDLDKVIKHHVGLFTSYFKKLKVDIPHYNRNHVWEMIFKKGITKQDFQRLRTHLAINRLRADFSGSGYTRWEESTLSIALSVAAELREWQLIKNQKDRVWIDKGGDLLGIIQLLLDDKVQPVARDLEYPIKSLDVDLLKLLMRYVDHKQANWADINSRQYELKRVGAKLTKNSLFGKSTPVDRAYKEISKIMENPEEFTKKEKQKTHEFKR